MYKPFKHNSKNNYLLKPFLSDLFENNNIEISDKNIHNLLNIPKKIVLSVNLTSYKTYFIIKIIYEVEFPFVLNK